MTRFYFLRHGETLFNKKRIIQGYCDSPLTELGKQQAKEVQASLSMIPFHAVYSSISERAYDTAFIATENRYHIHRTKQLKEIAFGELEGEREETVFDNAVNSSFFDLCRTGWREFGGENADDVVFRVREYIKKIAHQYSEGDILIVTHKAVIMLMAQAIAPTYIKQLERIGHAYVPNCSITIIDYATEFVLKEFAIKTIL